MITNKTKQKVIKELKEFLLEYETKPSYISAVRKVQGLHRGRYRRNGTPLRESNHLGR
jgi:hypothetical protein